MAFLIVFHHEAESGAWLTRTERRAAGAGRAVRAREAARSILPVLCMGTSRNGVGESSSGAPVRGSRGRRTVGCRVRSAHKIPGPNQECNWASNLTPQTNPVSIRPGDFV